MRISVRRSSSDVLHCFLRLSMHPAKARSWSRNNRANALWDTVLWPRDIQADEPYSRDEFREEHDDCVDDAAPDYFAAEHVCDWDGKAD